MWNGKDCTINSIPVYIFILFEVISTLLYLHLKNNSYYGLASEGHHRISYFERNSFMIAY